MVQQQCFLHLESFSAGIVGHWLGVFPELIHDKLHLERGRPIRLRGHTGLGLTCQLRRLRPRCGNHLLKFPLSLPQRPDLSPKPKQFS